MNWKITEHNGVSCAIYDNANLLPDEQSLLDLMMSISYDTGCVRLILNKAALPEDFFELRSGIAGGMLQKLVNYKMKLAIIGDFSMYTSTALRDFIRESNRGRDIFFVATEQEALDSLCKA